MSSKSFSAPTRRPLPLILVRGFGGLSVEDEKKIAYQGFNDGTVYPHKRGENYIYEGLILRLMKSQWEYHDATNVVGFFGQAIDQKPEIPEELVGFDPGFFYGHKVIIDPAMARHLLKTAKEPLKTLWVFRYYDLNDRQFKVYGEALVRLIDFIRELAKQKDGTQPKVNIIAHSMGGLIVREAVQRAYPQSGREADDYINKIVTLGTPHQGISFQILKDWIPVGAEDELEHFSSEFQEDAANEESFKNFHKRFPLERLLTVVGTNYRSYAVAPASWLNRLFSVAGEFGPNYNRSDGLVKQANAQIPGAPRTFVHKCHGGPDSLVTSRESFEIATRFFFGNIRARLRFLEGEVTRGLDWFGKSEIFLGVSIKPRKVDFELFHQSPEAENCFGPFRNSDFSDKEVAFSWADDNKLIWEGYLDVSRVLPDPSTGQRDLVMRLDFYLGERDLFGLGFSDNVIFRKQYYARALLPLGKQRRLEFYLHTSEDFRSESGSLMEADDKGWRFQVAGTGFKGTFGIEIDSVPEAGQPKPYKSK